MRHLSSIAFAIALIAAQPAQANCWDDTVLTEARLYEFHINVQSADERCHFASRSIEREYRDYFQNHGGRINRAAAVLSEVFSTKNGFAPRAMDKYTVALLNHHGPGETSIRYCNTIQRMLQKLADTASAEDDLHTFALVLVRDLKIEQFCRVSRTAQSK